MGYPTENTDQKNITPQNGESVNIIKDQKKLDNVNVSKLTAKISKVNIPSAADIIKQTPVVENKQVVPENKPTLDGDFKKFETEITQTPLTKDTLIKVMKDISGYKLTATNGMVNKNGYCEVLVNHVIKNPALLASYVATLKAQPLLYLGTDKGTQQRLYYALLNSNAVKTLDKNSVTYKDLLAVQFALKNQTSEELAQSIKENLNQVIEGYGAMLLNVIEWIAGGKGKLGEFCKRWKLEQYFPAIEKLYVDRYSLSDPQKKALEDPYKQAVDTFSGTDKISDGVTCDTKKIQAYYVDKWVVVEGNFQCLDPVLISRALQNAKITKFPNLIIPADKKYGEQEYKLNGAIQLSFDDKKEIIAAMFKDPSLWSDIGNLNSELKGESVYAKKDSSAADKKVLTDGNDIAMATGAYLMKGSTHLKYIISETKGLPNEADKISHKETDTKQSEWKNLFTSVKQQPSDLIGDKLDVNQKTERDIIVAGMNKLFNKVTHRDTISVLNSNAPLTDEFKIFIDTYLSVYLNSIIKDIKTPKDSIPKAQLLLDQKNSIKDTFAVSMASDKIIFSGKTVDKKDVSFDSTSIVELLSPEVIKS